MNSLDLQPLTAERFQPFGDVLDPNFEGPRVDHAAKLSNARLTAVPNLLLVRSTVVQLPHAVARMERHAFSSQTFLPLANARSIIAVARDNGCGAPDASTLAAFASDGQGFSYKAGIWHIPLATLIEHCAFAVFMYCDGTVEDTHWANLDAYCLR